MTTTNTEGAHLKIPTASLFTYQLPTTPQLIPYVIYYVEPFFFCQFSTAKMEIISKE